MPERDQGDHWDFLAADLGASPAPQEEAAEKEPESPTPEADVDAVEADEPSAVAQPADDSSSSEAAENEEEKPVEVRQEKTKGRQRGQKGDRVVSGFGYRRGSVDWANLARELGVEAMEEVPAPIPPGEAPSESKPFVAADLESLETESIQAEPLSAELLEEIDEAAVESPAQDQPTFGGFGAGILDELIPDPLEVQEGRGEADEEFPEERKGRRRRRRRKPKREEAEQEQPDEASTDEEAETEVRVVPEKEQEEEASPRRRGRRRGGRKRAPREEVTAASEEYGVGLDGGPVGSEEFDVFENGEVETDEEEDESTRRQKSHGERSKDRDQEKKPSKKVTHRGIPSWGEAVGHIIDSNMESRSKRPDGAGSRQRQGRRRGGDRSGNRGR